VPIERVVCCGGIAEKNDVFMQIYADVIGQPMLIAGSSQAPALGAAHFGGGDRRRASRRGRRADSDDVGARTKRSCPNPARMPSTMSSTKSTRDARRVRQRDQYDLGTVMKRSAGESKARASQHESARARLPRQSRARSTGLVMGTFGNLSIADRDAGVFAIKPSGVPYHDLRPDKIVLVSLETGQPRRQ
jgi:hypothetical protein